LSFVVYIVHIFLPAQRLPETIFLGLLRHDFFNEPRISLLKFVVDISSDEIRAIRVACREGESSCNYGILASLYTTLATSKGKEGEKVTRLSLEASSLLGFYREIPQPYHVNHQHW
jgi:hypothetical protein